MKRSRRVEWRTVPGWEGLYEVSSRGQVRSVERARRCGRGGRIRVYPSRILAQAWRGSHGAYLHVDLHDRANGRHANRAVHVLVCEAFHGPRPAGHQACHGPRGKECNAASNLRWGSPEQNRIDAERSRQAILRRYIGGLTEEQYAERLVAFG